MKELIALAQSISKDFRSLKEIFYEENREFSEHLACEWLDSREVMKILKISKRSLQYWRNKGTLHCNKVNGKFYYRAREVRGMLEGER